MQVMISTIKVPERIRKETGNLEPLMESLSRCGQLNPITLTRDLELIAGFRRLSSAQRLGWKMIDAKIVDGLSDEQRLEMELGENLYRKDFTPDELLEAVKRLDALRNPKLRTRMKKAFKSMMGKLAFWKRSPKASEASTEVAPATKRIEAKRPVIDDDSGDYGI